MAKQGPLGLEPRLFRLLAGALLLLLSVVGAAAGGAAASPSATSAVAQAPTPTPAPLATPTPTPTAVPTATPTAAAVPTATPTVTATPTPTVAPTLTPTPTATATVTPTPTPTPPPVPPSEPQAPGTYRVAFYADTAYSVLNANQQRYPYDYPDTSLSAPGRALKLIHAEGAELVLHGGDIGYDEGGRSTPEKWDLQVSQILGPDFPMFASVGNHDRRHWQNAPVQRPFQGLGYRDVLMNRYNAVEQNPVTSSRIDCTFDSADPIDSIGRRSTCTYRGNLTFVTVDSGQWESPTNIGQPDNQTEAYLNGALQSATTPWLVCNWHFNQTLFQTGGKTNEAGWKPYQYCRENGALIATGHEHAYSRTHVMSHFGEDSDPGDIVMTGPNLQIDEGQTVAWVSGLGGVGIRVERSPGENPWWAVKVNASRPQPNGTAGALFCDFKLNSNSNAVCYYKMIDGNVYDRFELVSNTNGGTGTFEQPHVNLNSSPFAPAIATQDVLTRLPETLQLSATDVDGPDQLEYWSTDLPPGFNLDRSTGFISGLFQQPGVYSSTVYAWDGLSSGRFDVTWNVQPAPITFTGTLNSQCIAEDGRIDLALINTGPLAETVRATLTSQPARQLTMAPEASGSFAWTGRPDGLYQVEVRALFDDSVVFAGEVFIACDPPLSSSCLQHNGRIDVSVVNDDTVAHSYTVTFGALTPRSRTIPARESTRVSTTGRPDGPLLVTIDRDGVEVFSETVDVDCDLDQVSYARSTVACLFGNGRVDVYLTNDASGPSTYVVTFGSLAPRSRNLGQNGATRVTTTGRPDGPMRVWVDRDGVRVLQQTIFINCD